MKFSLLPLLLLTGCLLAAGCDHGIVPPDEPERGVIRATIEYEQRPSEWPAKEEFHDLRFVALRFIPRDTTDFLQLNRLTFSDELAYGVSADTATIDDVETGAFYYSGVAQRFEENLLSWRPLGLVAENGGVFVVSAGETTHVHVRVDFEHLPDFPPSTP